MENADLNHGQQLKENAEKAQKEYEAKNAEYLEKVKAGIVGQYNGVREMNNGFNNLPFTEETWSWSKLFKQCKNIKSEIDELTEACEELEAFTAAPLSDREGYIKAFNKIRDALCDIMVFSYGALHFMDIDAEDTGKAITAQLAQGGVSVALPSGKPLLNPRMLVQVHTQMYQFYSHYGYLRAAALNGQQVEEVTNVLSGIIASCWLTLYHLGCSPDADMGAVIEGVMTRFLDDEADAEASIAHWAEKGVTDVAVEGEFPRAILRSMSDQPDSPKGKFLKPVSYRDTVFDDVVTPFMDEVEKVPA